MEGRIIQRQPVMAWMAGNVVVDTDPAGKHQADKGEVAGEDRWYRRCDHGTGPLHRKRKDSSRKRLRRAMT